MGEAVALRTTDGGTSWIPQSTGVTEYFFSVFYIDENIGWIAGGSGIILKTTDGGINWTSQSIGTNSVRDIYFVNTDTGWVVGDGGKIFNSTDGGTNWNSQVSGTIQGLRSVYFLNPNLGFISGGMGTILRTTDGGTNWVNQTSGNTYQLSSIFFVNSVSGWIVGEHGTILYTSDGGINWLQQSSPTGGWLHSVFFTDNNIGWISGYDGAILSTLNGGVPVELIYFIANSSQTNINLQWQTATETNNKGFEVQRKKECNVFESIGFVEGKGTTTEQHSYTYSDNNISSGKYYYRLKQVDYDGSYKYSNIINISVSSSLFSLNQNYPNPFNPSTKIKYSIPHYSFVQIKIFDILGNEIKTLIKGEKPAGNYEADFNAIELPSGIYIYRLTAGSYSASRKMILLK